MNALFSWFRKCALSLQAGKPVRQEVTIYSAFGDTSYYLCPKCGILLEREFVHYCDECGQKLNWHRIEVQLFEECPFP